ncbi:MAG TPA: hypothetical protein VLV17_05715 [Anaeromyxobacteraceae bacterium]|nr:hypothetical protein [Anaeromyxobacteraceae bacterium]
MSETSSDGSPRPVLPRGTAAEHGPRQTASRIPPSKARRLDRLARHAHAFHRLAHHPLCDAYSTELIRLGRRTRICRGCTLVALGFVCGTLMALLVGVAALLAIATLFAFALFAGARRPPYVKLFTRFGPAALVPALVILGFAASSLSGVALALAAVGSGFVAVALYRRRGPDRSPCLACPERALPGICSGLRPMVRRERAFARLAGRILATVSPRPALPRGQPGEIRCASRQAGESLGRAPVRREQ